MTVTVTVAIVKEQHHCDKSDNSDNIDNIANIANIAISIRWSLQSLYDVQYLLFV